MSNQWNTNLSDQGEWNQDGWGQAAPADVSWNSRSAEPQDYNNGRRRFHWQMLVSALVGALVGSGIGLLLYGRLYDPSGSNVVLVGLICGILVGCVLVACVICEMLTPRLTVDRQVTLRHFFLAVGVALLTFLVMCLCEFLYEINSAFTVAEFNDFIFAVDDSSSMSDSDPTDLRYSALAELLESMGEDKRVGLIRFTDQLDTEPVKMDYLTQGQRDTLLQNIQRHQSNGGTDIQMVLEKALEMYSQSQLAGRSPVVVLLSDGGSHVQIDKVAREYIDQGVAVSTVALGDGANVALLQNLAQATGGQYFEVEQADGLVQAFQQVKQAVSYRCLFSSRPGPQRGNVLYMLLRVVFLLLPALLVAGGILVLFPQRGTEKQLGVSAAAGLASGLLMEAGMYWFWPGGLVRLVCWMLWGLVLLHYIYRNSGIRQTGLKETDFVHGRGAFKRLVESQRQQNLGQMEQPVDTSQKELNRDDDWGV